jgi:glyoxylase-like metal-dependent hydrolase (beta-lactamase superfamily II)
MSHRVHHLNCATMRPPSQRLVNGEGSLFRRASLVAHCLLIETADGLVLVDTGLGRADVAHPKDQLPREFTLLTGPTLNEAETAYAQIRALGFSPNDVRHIVLTHLDVDHSGGIPDFPDATIHVSAPALEVELNPPPKHRARLNPKHHAHGPRWAPVDPVGEDWFGFPAVKPLAPGLDDVLLVPLPGHTVGHVGVAVRRDTSATAPPTPEAFGDQPWLLHVGDAAFHHGSIDPHGHCPPGLRLFEWVTATDRDVMYASQERLRSLAQDHGNEVALFTAHDPVTFARSRHRPA